MKRVCYGRKHASTAGSARAIVTRILGRPLRSTEIVHHVNLNELDDRPDNYVVCENHAYHRLIHQRTYAYMWDGNASARRCWICKCYDRQDNITVSNAQAFHRTCYQQYKKRQKMKKLVEVMA